MTFKQLIKGIKEEWGTAHSCYCSERAQLKKLVEKTLRKVEEEKSFGEKMVNAPDIIEKASSALKYYYAMDEIKEMVRTLKKIATKEEEEKWLENYFVKLDDEIWEELDNKIKIENIKREYENIYYN